MKGPKIELVLTQEPEEHVVMNLHTDNLVPSGKMTARGNSTKCHGIGNGHVWNLQPENVYTNYYLRKKRSAGEEERD